MTIFSRTRRLVGDAIINVRAAVLIARWLLRLRAGYPPWDSRTRAWVRGVAPSHVERWGQPRA
jgi:hypothetical protein